MWKAFYEAVDDDDVAIPLDEANRALLMSATASAASTRPPTPISDDDHDVVIRHSATLHVGEPADSTASYKVFKARFNPKDPANKKKHCPPGAESRRQKWTDTQRGYVEKAMAKAEKVLHPKTWVDFTEEVQFCVTFRQVISLTLFVAG